MPVYRLTWSETYAVLLGAAAMLVAAMRRGLVETDRECLYTWRGIVERTAVIWSAE